MSVAMIRQNWPADCPFRGPKNEACPQTLVSYKDEERPMSHTTLQLNRSPGAFWTLRREASLNWLALGLLLAAWNASDNDAATGADARRRPEGLRGYSYVSVRAANRMTSNRMTEVDR
jgi:hypothetical protein